MKIKINKLDDSIKEVINKKPYPHSDFVTVLQCKTYYSVFNYMPIFFIKSLYECKLKNYNHNELQKLINKYNGDGLKAVHVYLYNQKLKKRKRK